MIESAYSLNERANLRGRSTPSNPVMFGLPRMRKTIIQHLVPPESTPTTYRRCFRQFDRKTDCFDGGFGMGHSPVEVQFLANSGRRAWFKSMRLTFKAVCGTQTKQGGCLYEQPCSQVLENEAFTRFLDKFARIISVKGKARFCHKFRTSEVV